MTRSVVAIWRHPIKSHGWETLRTAELSAGRTLPWDRTWAIAHEAAEADGSKWVPCVNFSRGSKAPGLMAITARLDEETERVELTHPDLGRIEVHPERDAEALIAWSAPLIPKDRAASARVVRVPERGMTDTPFPSISLLNTASNRAVGEKLGKDLDPRRWRGNFWLDGLGPFEEFELVGREVAIGGAVVKVVEPITRCLATTANPETGKRDADTLDALERGWGHRDFGVYAEVVSGGTVAVGDSFAAR